MDPLLTKFEGLLKRMETLLQSEETKGGKQEHKPEHQEAKPVDKTALFAEIAKKGTDVTKELKAVDKGAKPPEPAKPVAKPPEAKAAKPVKPPTTSKTGPNTFYENYVDTNLVFKAEELSMSDGFYLRDARNSTFDFQGKIKNIFVDHCENVKVICKVLPGWFNV